MFHVPTGSYQEELDGNNIYSSLQNMSEHTILQEFANIEKIAKNSFYYIGYIACSKVKHSFIAIATLVTQKIVLTTRHTLNGFACTDLIFFYNDVTVKKTEYSSLSLLEDGSNFSQDYALLYLNDFAIKRPIKFTTKLPRENSYFTCINLSAPVLNKLLYKIAEVPSRPSQQSLVFESPLKSCPGFSGSPYINESGTMFGLHLSGYSEQSIWSNKATGISLGQLANNVAKNSFFYFIVNNLSFNPLVRPFYFFDEFTLSLTALGQIDEGRRESALGYTPKLTSLTGTQVLLRYFLKDKAKFTSTNKYTIKEKRFLYKWKNEWEKYAQNYLGYRDIAKVSGDYFTLYNLLVRTEEWLVKIKMPQNGNFGNAKHTWINLAVTKNKNSSKAGIQMGHKMGAVDYWAYGAGTKDSSGWLKDERIPQIKNSTYDTPQKKNEKITKLEKRYSLYKNPGHKDYNKPQREHFMKEPWNYHFQWWQINQRDGALARQKTQYKDYAPKDYKWKGTKLIKK